MEPAIARGAHLTFNINHSTFIVRLIPGIRRMRPPPFRGNVECRMLNVEWSVPSLEGHIQHSTLTIQHSSSPSSRRLRLIPISHPVNRIDAIELRIDRLELLADPLDVAVDGALADVVV